MRIHHKTTITDFVGSPTFGMLAGTELSLFLRLIAASAERGRRMKMTNGELPFSAATVRKAFAKLEDLGLVKVTVAAVNGHISRTVELVA